MHPTGVRLVTFTLEDHAYGVDVAAVQEVLRGLPRTPIPLAPPSVAGLINLRGQVLTAIDLRPRLGLAPRHRGRAEEDDQMLIVIRAAGETLALLVDSIDSVVDVEPDQFEPPPDTLTGGIRDVVRGVYKLPGSLLLHLDVDRAVAA